MSTSEQIQKDIKFNLDRLAAADAKIVAIAELRCRLYRDTLDRVQRYVEAKLAEQAQGKTTEPCPVCQAEATCEHGVRDAGNGMFVHLWHCSECGDSAPFVGFDCPDCLKRDKAQAVTVSSGVSR